MTNGSETARMPLRAHISTELPLTRSLAPAAVLTVLLPLSGLARAAAPPTKDRIKNEPIKEETPAPKGGWTADTWSGLALRSIGPAVTSGRVVDIAVDPTDKKRWFLAVASGGVWKTENAGISLTPVFDGEGSYSIGCVTIDPKDPYVVWVGTGENNAQRSVGYGDGVYKSTDGGKSWKNVGLKASEHVGKILVDPRDSNVVYVAAQGPLWAPGGDRGLYKTTDGGKTWNAVLTIEREHRRQRRRHGPARPRRADRGRLAAPAPRLHADRRRPRVRPAQDDRRRQDLAQDHERPAEGGDGPDRPGARAERPRRRLRAGRDGRGRQGRGHLPLHRPRRDLGEALRLQPRRADVLPGDLRRPEERGARLLDGRLPEGDRRRRQDLAQPRRALQARRQPRAVDRPRRHRPLPRRLRRRALRELRPRGDLALLRQPAGDPVLPRRRRRLAARLLRLRRHPGQQHPGRPLAHAERARHRQLRLVRHLGRRRLPRADRPRRPQHRLLRRCSTAFSPATTAGAARRC